MVGSTTASHSCRWALAGLIIILAGCGGGTKTVVSTVIIRTSTTTVTSGTAASPTPDAAIAGIRKAYRRLLLAEYFGPPADVCQSLTPADQAYFARAGRATNCLAAARPLQRNQDPNLQHVSPSEYRQVVAAFTSKLRLVRLSGVHATVIDGYGTVLTLVEGGGEWLFDRGSVPILNS